jgi:hypothetical protein
VGRANARSAVPTSSFPARQTAWASLRSAHPTYCLGMADLPNRVTFLGRVYPLGAIISITVPEITFREGKGLFTAKYSVQVLQSEITVHCDFDNFRPNHPYTLWIHAQEITQTLVNLVAFQSGMGTITILNEYIDAHGKRDVLTLADPALRPLCTAFSRTNRFMEVVQAVFAEPDLFMAFNDLAMSNAMPSHILINCARCVEAIRTLIAPPDTDRTKAWGIMQVALNVDRTYLAYITDLSIGPRHGKPTPITDAIALEVRARTWRIMDRFLHYRLGKNQPLSPEAFPLLRG